jgi:hypothetical protein
MTGEARTQPIIIAIIIHNRPLLSTPPSATYLPPEILEKD